MSDDSEIPCLKSQHFTLLVDWNAFGKTLHIRERASQPILLYQRFNDWANEHWYPSLDDNNHRALLIMLEAAYDKGHAAARSEIQKALGFNG